MSVTVRPYVNGGWEVDIRVELPDGTIIRERKKASATGKAAAQRWAEARERVLPVNGKPKRAQKEEVLETPTLKEFAPRFVDGYAKANRLKPSGIAGKKSILKMHLVPQLGDKRLDNDLDRKRATAEVRSCGSLCKDRQQHPDGVERDAEDGRRVGSDRTPAVPDQAPADAEERGQLP